MKEFIDKLIGRLEKQIFSAELHDYGWEGQTVHNLLVLGDVRDIADQLAEEYNNGWISVDDRLPSETAYYLVTIKGFNRPMYAWWIRTEKKWYYLNSQREIYDVIAWQPLPPKYEPKGE